MKRITINLIRADGEVFWKGQTEFGSVVLCKSPIDNIFPIALNLNSLQMVISSNEQPGFSLIKLCQSGGYWAWNLSGMEQQPTLLNGRLYFPSAHYFGFAESTIDAILRRLMGKGKNYSLSGNRKVWIKFNTI